MSKTTSMLVSFALSALLAVPATGGDFGGRSFPRHRGFSHAGPTVIGHHVGWNDGRIRFADGFSRFGHHPWRNRLLSRVSSPTAGYARNNITIVVQPPQDGWAGGTYAGSSFAYETNGGTYASSSGYSTYYRQSATSLAPMAKVIDVTAKGSSCSFEAGVCVIRP